MSFRILNNGNVIEEARELTSSGEYDVVVCGGGMAGFGAAVAASRKGARVLLVERETALGGLATVGLVPIPKDTPAGISKEMISRLEEVDAHTRRNSDPEKHKLILDRMVREANIDLLLDTAIVDAVVEDNKVRGVVLESKSGREVVMGKRFVDCTGDADLAYFAGCECMSGRPEDGKHQACSIDFRLGGVDYDKYLASDLKANDPQWIKLIEEAHHDGRMPVMYENHLNWSVFVPGRPKHCGKDEICICIAHSRNCDPLSNRDLTRMYVEGREQVDFWARFIRENVPEDVPMFCFTARSNVSVLPWLPGRKFFLFDRGEYGTYSKWGRAFGQSMKDMADEAAERLEPTQQYGLFVVAMNEKPNLFPPNMILLYDSRKNERPVWGPYVEEFLVFAVVREEDVEHYRSMTPRRPSNLMQGL